MQVIDQGSKIEVGTLIGELAYIGGKRGQAL
jgi:hypothetical protein